MGILTEERRDTNQGVRGGEDISDTLHLHRVRYGVTHLKLLGSPPPEDAALPTESHAPDLGKTALNITAEVSSKWFG